MIVQVSFQTCLNLYTKGRYMCGSEGAKLSVNMYRHIPKSVSTQNKPDKMVIFPGGYQMNYNTQQHRQGKVLFRCRTAGK